MEKKNNTPICDLLPLGILVFNLETEKFDYQNPSFNGYSKKEKREIFQWIQDFFQQCTDFGDRKVYRFIMEDNIQESISTVEFSIYPLDNRKGLVLVDRDAPERIHKLVEKESHFYNKFSQLGAEIAHEIGNPLSGMNTTLEVLQTSLNEFSQAEVIEYLDRIAEEVKRMFSFLGTIRNITDETSMRLKSVRLKKFVNGVINQRTELLKLRKVSFKNNIDDDLEVYIDEFSFNQVLLELITNSLENMASRGVITVRGEIIENSYIKIIYTNNGKSIPISHMERIFLPLFSTKKRGNGFGLAQAQKSMTRMGGTIMAVPPDDGVGARFLLYVPQKYKRP